MPDFLVNPASDQSFSWAPARSNDLLKAQESFLSVLGKQQPEYTPMSPEEKARSVAEQYVSIALVQPLLKELRETSNAAPPFAPTQAEKQFRALSDADLAQRIVHARQFPLVDRLARDLLKRGGEAPELPAPLPLERPELKVLP